ncbi:hypothetical protein B0H14DRAFT_2610296 [Mycena olivaceomarginata]|nr:hypothetical protein B0H14DRAFT_2610296 [Mycena olivaceomarginata]
MRRDRFITPTYYNQARSFSSAAAKKTHSVPDMAVQRGKSGLNTSECQDKMGQQKRINHPGFTLSSPEIYGIFLKKEGKKYIEHEEYSNRVGVPFLRDVRRWDCWTFEEEQRIPFSVGFQARRRLQTFLRLSSGRVTRVIPDSREIREDVEERFMTVEADVDEDSMRCPYDNQARWRNTALARRPGHNIGVGPLDVFGPRNTRKRCYPGSKGHWQSWNPVDYTAEDDPDSGGEAFRTLQWRSGAEEMRPKEWRQCCNGKIGLAWEPRHNVIERIVVNGQSNFPYRMALIEKELKPVTHLVHLGFRPRWARDEQDREGSWQEERKRASGFGAETGLRNADVAASSFKPTSSRRCGGMEDGDRLTLRLNLARAHDASQPRLITLYAFLPRSLAACPRFLGLSVGLLRPPSSSSLYLFQACLSSSSLSKLVIYKNKGCLPGHDFLLFILDHIAAGRTPERLDRYRPLANCAFDPAARKSRGLGVWPGRQVIPGPEARPQTENAPGSETPRLPHRFRLENTSHNRDSVTGEKKRLTRINLRFTRKFRLEQRRVPRYWKNYVDIRTSQSRASRRTPSFSRQDATDVKKTVKQATGFCDEYQWYRGLCIGLRERQPGFPSIHFDVHVASNWF